MKSCQRKKKNKNGNFIQLSFLQLLKLTPLLCFKIPIDGRLIREDELSCQIKRLLSEIDTVDLRIDFLKKEGDDGHHSATNIHIMMMKKKHWI